MDRQNEKCVMIIDEGLPLGLIANTAAIMGITLGKKLPEVVGADVIDQSGNRHLGIIEFPVPVLRGTQPAIQQIREKLYQPEMQDLTVVDFSDLAQGCKTYDEFIIKNGAYIGKRPAIFGNRSLRPEEKDQSAYRQYGAAEIGERLEINILRRKAGYFGRAFQGKYFGATPV